MTVTADILVYDVYLIDEHENVKRMSVAARSRKEADAKIEEAALAAGFTGRVDAHVTGWFNPTTGSTRIGSFETK